MCGEREREKKKKGRNGAMFTRVYLSRECFLVDARTVVYLNIAIEEKRSKNFAASVPRISRVGNITLASKRDSYLLRTDCNGQNFYF